MGEGGKHRYREESGRKCGEEDKEGWGEECVSWRRWKVERILTHGRDSYRLQVWATVAPLQKQPTNQKTVGFFSGMQCEIASRRFCGRGGPGSLSKPTSASVARVEVQGFREHVQAANNPGMMGCGSPRGCTARAGWACAMYASVSVI